MRLELLPKCRHRGDDLPNGRMVCHSTKIIARNGVMDRHCLECPWPDHEPQERQVGPPAATVQKVPPKGGPGTELKNLLESIGISPDNCACKSRAIQMDEWGAAGCKERRIEIIGWLKEEWNRLGWVQRIGAGMRAIISKGPVSLTDPIGAFLDEAISRAEGAANATAEDLGIRNHNGT